MLNTERRIAALEFIVSEVDTELKLIFVETGEA